MRLELTRPNGHYPLKVARLPIPPLLHYFYKTLLYVPRTGLEPARLSTLAPETSASTIPPPGLCISESGKRGSNSRPQPWQGCALPTELFPRLLRKLEIFCCARCVKINFPTRWQRKFRIYLSNLHFLLRQLYENKKDNHLVVFLERKTRLELATPTLARLCSTN